MAIRKEETHDIKIVCPFTQITCPLEDLRDFVEEAIKSGFELTAVVTYQSNIPGLTISRSVLEKDN